MAARVIARTELTDLAEGSVLLHLLGAVAEELNLTELRLARIRDSYFFERISSAELDQRASELPPNGLQRRPATFAQGSVLTLTRTNEASEAQIAAGEDYPDPLPVPAGSTFTRSDDPSVLYTTTEEVVFAGSPSAGNPGESQIFNVYARASLPGEAGNCAAHTIVSLVSVPSQVIAVTNNELENGHERETDEQLKNKIVAYMSSLARCQPTAIEFVALDFVSSTGSRAMFASLYEHPVVRGFSELVVDDGSGLAGAVTAGSPTQGVVPFHGQNILYHDPAATAAIASITVTRGAVSTVYTHASKEYISLYERGLVYFPIGVLLPGDEWEIAGYDVYTGLVAELQKVIEGDTSRPIDFPGWRAAGTRIAVRPALTQVLDMDVHIIPESFVALSEVAEEIKEATVAFFRTLGPGDTFYVAQLIDLLMNNQKMISVRIYEPGTGIFMQDQPAPGSSYDTSWRTTLSAITIIPALP